jgi:hypothetical protein
MPARQVSVAVGRAIGGRWCQSQGVKPAHSASLLIWRVRAGNTTVQRHPVGGVVHKPQFPAPGIIGLFAVIPPPSVWFIWFTL